MSNCCSSSGEAGKHPKRARCPADGQECREVPVRTITHHLRQPWAWVPSATHYYFCAAGECDIVYFGDDGSTILKSQLRTRVGVKERTADDLLCYCFGVSFGDFQHRPTIKEFVIAQTKAGWCSCDTSNPSGSCCLKDFPKPES